MKRHTTLITIAIAVFMTGASLTIAAQESKESAAQAKLAKQADHSGASAGDGAQARAGQGRER